MFRSAHASSVLAALLLLVAAQTSKSAGQAATADLSALSALEPFDTHTHIAKGDPAFYAMLRHLHMHILDIAYFDDHDAYRKDLKRQQEDAQNVVHSSNGHAAFCTTFDPFLFSNPDFTASTIHGLNQDFANGAIAVKIWKNIGMELKDKDGHYVFADGPKFEPIYQDIQKHNRTLIAHQAEPDEAWGPPNPNGLDYPYYKEHPTWYMYNKPGVPTKKQILDARDRLLAQNPKLRVVGAHLGSMEDDLEGLGQRLDRYPNFAVDTAARVVHLVVMPTDKVRAFILKYQDRIVYGTDLEFSKDDSVSDVVKQWQGQYARDWRYFSTHDTFEYKGHKTQGLGLPREVLRKLYHTNAVHWFPGILSTSRRPETSHYRRPLMEPIA
ncbi:MAG TPA: amidohydrolase family protein [Terriglobales bacterium]|nr:amidohydrolase family protein [Terriglobales bacterium]